MSIAFRVYSVEPSVLAQLVADPDAVDSFVMAYYCEDIVEDDFEAKWLAWPLGAAALPSNADMALTTLVR